MEKVGWIIETLLAGVLAGAVCNGAVLLLTWGLRLAL
jgi:hypothetical protein